MFFSSHLPWWPNLIQTHKTFLVGPKVSPQQLQVKGKGEAMGGTGGMCPTHPSTEPLHRGAVEAPLWSSTSEAQPLASALASPGLAPPSRMAWHLDGCICGLGEEVTVRTSCRPLAGISCCLREGPEVCHIDGAEKKGLFCTLRTVLRESGLRGWDWGWEAMEWWLIQLLVFGSTLYQWCDMGQVAHSGLS